jgi:hypothetical protein
MSWSNFDAWLAADRHSGHDMWVGQGVRFFKTLFGKGVSRRADPYHAAGQATTDPIALSTMRGCSDDLGD